MSNKKCTARQARAAYIKCRRRGQSAYKPNPRWNYCWQVTADTINELGCDVLDYIEVQFASVLPFPHPNTLHSTASKLRYTMHINNVPTFSKDFKKDVKKRFNSMLDLLERKANMGFEVDKILSNETYNFTPLFRVAISKHLVGDTSKVEGFIDEAKEEYDSHNIYEEIYEKYINDWNTI